MVPTVTGDVRDSAAVKSPVRSLDLQAFCAAYRRDGRGAVPTILR
jgi:hypothetical protein